MSDTALDEKRIRDEAAGWYAKLNHTTISTDTIRADHGAPGWRSAELRIGPRRTAFARARQAASSASQRLQRGFSPPRTGRRLSRWSPFGRVCIDNDIEHRLTKPNHRWTNGQAERMNRTIKDAKVKVYHHDDLESLKAHPLAFGTAHKPLKALRWRTLYQAIGDDLDQEPLSLQDQPRHLFPGPHT